MDRKPRACHYTDNMLRLALFAALLATALAYVPIGTRLPVIPSPRFPTAGKIVGGEATTIDQVPYQVAFLYGGSLICGGCLVRANAVVSAAHCVISSSASLYSFRAGSSEHASGGSVIGASSVRAHESYNSGTIDYDISFFTLSSSFTLGTNIAVISLPSQGQTVADGSTSVVSGWGSTQEGGSVVATIRRVSIPIINQNTCISAYASLGWSVTDRMICAGILNGGGQDACQGDSGGPLAVSGQLIGVTSWGYGCARSGFPGVWARVPALVTWINSN